MSHASKKLKLEESSEIESPIGLNSFLNQNSLVYGLGASSELQYSFEPFLGEDNVPSTYLPSLGTSSEFTSGVFDLRHTSKIPYPQQFPSVGDSGQYPQSLNLDSDPLYSAVGNKRILETPTSPPHQYYLTPPQEQQLLQQNREISAGQTRGRGRCAEHVSPSSPLEQDDSNDDEGPLRGPNTYLLPSMDGMGISVGILGSKLPPKEECDFETQTTAHTNTMAGLGPVPTTGPDSTRLEKLQANHYLFKLKAIENKLKEMRTKILQSHLLYLEHNHVLLRQEMESYKREFEKLESQHFLEATDFKSLQALQEFIDSYLLPQLNLYEMDIDQLKNPQSLNNREIPVYLSVTQDGAGPIFKEKPIGPFTIRLLTGAGIQQIQSSPVYPELVDASQRIKHNNQDLENQKQTFNENGVAIFNDLKFSSGTFPNLVKLKFKATIQVVIDSQTVTKQIESHHSKPYISMTNTGSQWKDSQGSWLKEDCFKNAADNTEISMAKFWNYFQKHYLIATKQEVSAVKRPLWMQDFEYLLFAKFKKDTTQKTTITQKEFEKFWDWVGPALKKIRYQKYLLWLFENGYLAAFVTGQEAEEQLKDEVDGAFLIRMSERLDGEFVISYRHLSGVRHYLIQPDDTADKKKTLIDFLGQNKNFLHMLQVRHDTNGKRTFYRYNKDKVLAKYYKKAPKQSAKNQSLATKPYDTHLL